MNQQHRSKPKENGENEGSNRKRNRPEPLRNLNDNANDEYKPFDNSYNSPLSSPIIKEKIESVLHFASTPLVEDGTPDFLLYETWHTPSTSPALPEDFFSVEHTQQRERELYNSRNHLLQDLVDLVETAVPSTMGAKISLVGDTVSETDLVEFYFEHQEGSQRSSSFSSQPLLKYLPVASGYSISNHPAQFDSFTSNLNSLLFDTPPVTPTSHLFAPYLSSSLFGTSLITSTAYLPPGKSQSDLRSIKPSPPNEACGYCIATCKFPQNHNKKECPKLACMKPCKICNASGNDNHTLTYCPLKEKVTLKLKCDKRDNADMDNIDNESDKDEKDNTDNKDD